MSSTRLAEVTSATRSWCSFAASRRYAAATSSSRLAKCL